MCGKRVLTGFLLSIMLATAWLCADECCLTSDVLGVTRFDVTATFEHLNLTMPVTAVMQGSVNCSFIKTDDNGYSVTFRVEAGSDPSALALSWNASICKKDFLSPSLPIILTSENTTETTLSNWMALKRNSANPALTFLVSPKLIDQSVDLPIEYTNLNPIKAKAFILDNQTDQIEIYQYATILIPAQSITLKKNHSNLSDVARMSITCSSIRLENISKKLLWKLFAKIHIKGRTCSSVSEDFSAIEHSSSVPVLFTEAALRMKSVLTDLYTTPSVKPAVVRKMMRSLDSIVSLQKGAKTVRAISQMIVLEKTITKLTETGDLPADAAPILKLHTSGILDNIVKANNSIADLTCTLSPPVFSLAYVTWYVDQSVTYPTSDGTIDPDGSHDHPFESIAQALEKARDISVMDLTLYVYSGVYNEPLIIDRDTTLNAVAGGISIISGTILNLSASTLRINGFYLLAADGPGAVFVSNSDAVTVISNTIVQDATRFGIYQYGGDITLNNVQVYNTQLEASQQRFGTGICLRGGVHAVFSDVFSSNNDSFGIIVEDVDTNLVATRLIINSNILNRLYADDYIADPLSDIYFAGMVVRYNATATISVLRMAANEGSGIIAYNNGSVNLSDASINNTVRFEPSGGWTGGISYGGGSAVWAFQGGYINMVNFTLSHSDLAGAVVGSGGAMDLSYGEISYNPIGAAIFDDTFDYIRLTYYVRFRENGTNLQTDTLPIPDPGF